jgi:threonine/homoserine/homoserine lactone efflux protein
MEAVLKGIASGLLLAILVGPVFFTLIQTSIERGFKSGIYVAVGISLSDAICIAIAYFGISNLLTSPQFKLYLTYFGGAMLACFGLYYLFIKNRKPVIYNPEHIQERSPFRLMSKGFVINGFNPMVLFFWIGTVGVATGELGYTSHGMAIIFFSSIVVTVFITDVIKAKLSDKLRILLTAKIIKVMNLVVGIVMLGFGLKLIIIH